MPKSVTEENLPYAINNMEFVFVKGGCFEMGDTFDMSGSYLGFRLARTP
ncbi:MAG: hypothetical protein MRK02_06925 [Candidatus Scalindua sp.]|nr:hypothetical protein [Candidatus Scalindua sp.]